MRVPIQYSMVTEACHTCKEPACDWTMVRCSKGKYCRELFCFACLSKNYPGLYGSVFRGICWACPACLGSCNCDVCTDPVKKQELQQTAMAKYQEEQDFIASHKPDRKQAATREPPNLIIPSPVIVAKSGRNLFEEGENCWLCPRCSVVNNTEEIECIACCFHRKRTTRKRGVYCDPPSYEEKHHVQKPEPKRARDVCYDDKSPPVKGRVSALRQLVKKPWTDGWDLARKLALDLVEEARQQAIKQGLPVLQVRQLPTKYQLANNRGTHVRKWFDREPTLAKKFLRAAGLICSKSNGTFIKEDIKTLDDLPALIRKADLTRYDNAGSLSDEAEDHLGSSSASVSPSSPILSPSSPSYQPKLKVYYHNPNEPEPFVFKVPITDLKTIDELQGRLAILLREMGQIGTDDVSKPLVLSGGGNVGYLSDVMPCSSIEDLSRCSLIHVHAQ